MNDIVVAAVNLIGGDGIVINKLQSIDNVIIGPISVESPTPPTSPTNLSVTGVNNYNPLTWDYDGSDPDYFKLEFAVGAGDFNVEKGYTNSFSGTAYDAKSNGTWYIPGNLRLVYVTYGDFGTLYKLRLFAEVGGVLSDSSNIVNCYITMG